MHYAVIWKYLYGSIKMIYIQPMSIVSVRLNSRPAEQSVIDLAVCYFIVNILLVLAGGCLISVTDELDYLSAMSAVIAALMNIGRAAATSGRPRITPLFQTLANGS